MLKRPAEQRSGAPSLAAAGAGRPVTPSAISPDTVPPGGGRSAMTQTTRLAARSGSAGRRGGCPPRPASRPGTRRDRAPAVLSRRATPARDGCRGSGASRGDALYRYPESRPGLERHSIRRPEEGEVTMNVRWMIPTAAVAISLAAIASAQTSTAPATRARTAAAAAPAVATQASAGVATAVAPVAAPSDVASVGQAPPAPPSPPPPSPPAAATAPQAPPPRHRRRVLEPVSGPRARQQVTNQARRSS